LVATEHSSIYTLSLHDALPISLKWWGRHSCLPLSFVFFLFVSHTISVVTVLPLCSSPDLPANFANGFLNRRDFLVTDLEFSRATDRKSTRLNSSHRTISYAVFC